MFAGRLGTGPDEREVAEAARASIRAPAQGAADLLLDALVTRFTEGYAASVAPLARALRAFGEPDGGGEDRRWLWLACRLAQDLWDDELWHAARDPRRAHRARDRRAQPAPERAQPPRRAQRPFRGLRHRRGADRRGRRDHAGDRASRRSSTRRACWPRRAAIRRSCGVMVDDAGSRTRRRGARARRCRRALVADRAAAQRPRPLRRGARGGAQRACEHEDVMAYGWALVELIEAGVRAGRPDEAAAALERLSERTRASGTEWALGIEARCRALLSDDESLYRESIERLARSRAARRARAQPAPVRGVAAAREPAHGRARAPARRPRELQPDGGRRRSPSAPAASCSPPARPRAGSPRTRATP